MWSYVSIRVELVAYGGMIQHIIFHECLCFFLYDEDKSISFTYQDKKTSPFNFVQNLTLK